MKKTAMALSCLIFFSSCGTITFVRNILKSRLTVQEIVDRKDEMDKADNPAYVYQMTQKLRNTRVRINNIEIKDIIASTNVDYRFCILVLVPTSKGDIECYIYAGTDDIFPDEDVKTISKLKKSKTKVNIEGDFNKFLPLFDESFTKIEIVNASINIKNI